MRLTTIARKTGIKPSKLIEFLIGEGIEPDNGVNTRLDDATISIIKQKFNIEEPVLESLEKSNDVGETEGPHVQNHDLKNEQDEEIALTPGKPQIDDDNTVAETIELEPEEPVAPKSGTIDDLEQGEADHIELIKAKKIKLEGIRVLGKIELPEKLKKPEEQEDEKPKAKQPKGKIQKAVAKNDRTGFERKKGAGSYQSRQNLSYEEKLKIEERKKRKLLQQKLKKEKELKRKYYEKNIQSKSINKPVKDKKKTNTEPSQPPVPVPGSSSPVRRLWDWLNGRYDR